MKKKSNSSLYYKRLKTLKSTGKLDKYTKKSPSKNPRIPRLKKSESPRHHSDLFVDEGDFHQVGNSVVWQEATENWFCDWFASNVVTCSLKWKPYQKAINKCASLFSPPVSK